jgi:hypothetical protein
MMAIVLDERDLLEDLLPLSLKGEDELVLGFTEDTDPAHIDQVRDAAAKGADMWELEALIDKLLGIPQPPSQ